MKKTLLLYTFLAFGLQSYCQTQKIDSIVNNPAIIEEFQLLNICHCIEFLEVSNYKGKDIFLKNSEFQLYARYNSYRLHEQYFDSLYQHSLFFKLGVGAYFEKQFNYAHLDSSYYKPIFDHYINNTIRVEGKFTKKGMSDHNAFFDCFYKVKEIDLKMELRKFIVLNRTILFE